VDKPVDNYYERYIPNHNIRSNVP